MGAFDDIRDWLLGIKKGSAYDWVMWRHNDSNGDEPCFVCASLHECWFRADKNPRSRITQFSGHFSWCHCSLEKMPVELMRPKAECDIRKFTEYIFADDFKRNKGKKKLFNNYGYNIIDAEYLKKEFERQALEKYLNGNYDLNKLDKYGQRINIIIELPQRNESRLKTFSKRMGG